jgi:lysophospholipase L1-like esterase
VGLRVETVNAAVPGYTSEHARLMLETELSRFDGDYLFVYLGWNDLFHHGPEALPLARMARAGYELNPLQRALTHVYTVRLLYAAQVLRSKYEPTVDEPLDEREDALYGGYEPRHFYDHVRAILRLAKERYPHVYLMTMATVTNDAPTAAELRKAHFPRGMDKNMRKLDVLVAAYNEAIRTLGREEGVPILDFEALFEGREARGGLLDSCHFNHEGAARAARLVADEVLAREREQPSAAGALAR